MESKYGGRGVGYVNTNAASSFTSTTGTSSKTFVSSADVHLSSYSHRSTGMSYFETERKRWEAERTQLKDKLSRKENDLQLVAAREGRLNGEIDFLRLAKQQAERRLEAETKRFCNEITSLRSEKEQAERQAESLAVVSLEETKNTRLASSKARRNLDAAYQRMRSTILQLREIKDFVRSLPNQLTIGWKYKLQDKLEALARSLESESVVYKTSDDRREMNSEASCVESLQNKITELELQLNSERGKLQELQKQFDDTNKDIADKDWKIKSLEEAIDLRNEQQKQFNDKPALAASSKHGENFGTDQSVQTDPSPTTAETFTQTSSHNCEFVCTEVGQEVQEGEANSSLFASLAFWKTKHPAFKSELEKAKSDLASSEKRLKEVTDQHKTAVEEFLREQEARTALEKQLEASRNEVQRLLGNEQAITELQSHLADRDKKLQFILTERNKFQTAWEQLGCDRDKLLRDNQRYKVEARRASEENQKKERCSEQLSEMKKEVEKVKSENDSLRTRLMSSAISRDTRNFQNLNDDTRSEKAIDEFKDLCMNQRLETIDVILEFNVTEDEAMCALSHCMAAAVEVVQSSVKAFFDVAKEGVAELLSLAPEIAKAFQEETEFYFISVFKKNFSSLNVEPCAQALISKIKEDKEFLRKIPNKHLLEFSIKSVRTAWLLSLQNPPFLIDVKDKEYVSDRHQLHADSPRPGGAAHIKYFVWPTLLSPAADGQPDHVLEKGIVFLSNQ